MNEVLKIFYFETPQPTSYGWFHLLFMAITIAFTAFMCAKFKDCSDKTFKRIALISWIVMFTFEVYKQLVFTFTYENGSFVSDYEWRSFPFQLCSTPLYVLPFIAFMKEGKLRDALTSYISTFAFFGGLVVFFYPNDVFHTDYLGIQIQTMVHHGLQVALGVYFAVYNRKKLNIKYFLTSIPVFIVLLLVAVLLNEIVHGQLVKIGSDEEFSMFYVSPYVANHLPILSTVYNAVSWIVFLIAYAVGFNIASLIVFFATIGGIKLVNYIINKKTYAKE